jgi:DNA-binding NarL/FixJ family response regulator
MYMPEDRVKVLIADDHPLVIAGIRRALEHDEDIEIVGEARSGSELMQLVERRQPGVVLMDLKMPGTPAVECIQRIAETWPEMKTIVLSAYDDRPTIDSALRAGATSYIVKSVKPIDLASVLRQASTGAVFHAPPAPRNGDQHQPMSADAPALTERERTILAAVASGLTTAAISKQLWLSEHTVKFHLTNIYRKLGVENRACAIRYALEHGMTS